MVVNPEPYQGDVIKITATKKPTYALFNGLKSEFFEKGKNFVALLPVSGRMQKGTYTISIYYPEQPTLKRKVTVRAKTFPKVVLGIPKNLSLSSGALVEKLGIQNVQIDEIVQQLTSGAYFKNETFRMPLDGSHEVSSPFGEIRTTGNSVIRHWGIDFKATKGTPVYAMASGVVKKSYLDSVYGNTVIIDHGEGVYTLSMHLDTRNVEEGDSVHQGEVIGAVGNTGYSTSPHLHLSIKVRGVAVDPLRFIDIVKKD